MRIWEFYRALGTISFTLWWLTLAFIGPLPVIKFNHWIYETVRASWWISEDIEKNLGEVVGGKSANAEVLVE